MQAMRICTSYGWKSSFAVTPSYLRSRGFEPQSQPMLAILPSTYSGILAKGL